MDFNRDDPKAVWQNQPTETSTMTLKLIRQRARHLHARTRLELFSNIGMGVITVAIAGPGVVLARNWIPRVAFALAIVWTLAGQFFIHRGMWSRTMPGDAALGTGLEFYRREVERRGYLFRSVLRWSFGPVVLAICGVILVFSGIATKEGKSVRAMMPFCTLFAVWMVAFLLLRSRRQRALQREMDDLQDSER